MLTSFRVSQQYLTYFDDDDEKLKRIHDEYKTGTLSTGEMKKTCITVMQNFVKDFQERRAKVTDEMLREYMTPRKLDWNGNPIKPGTQKAS